MDFSNKFILELAFDDDTKVHYILDISLLRPDYNLDSWKYKILSKSIPEIVMDDDLISRITEFHYWSIGNGLPF